MKKLKLIDEWKQAWRLFSVRMSLIGIALPQVWASLPQDQREAVLDLVGLKGLAALVSLLFALVIAVRVIAQPGVGEQK